MEKAITFTNEQKGLIWSRFVQPANGTEEEAKHFVSVCEEFGLNPLLGDIVFQRYESRNGPKTQFITTRDGLLRVSSRQPDYVGAPNANVVREGDIFKFMPSEGQVHHEFGEKRGKILGAYAVLKHKRFDPVAVFVDFEEYFKANSGVLTSKYKNKNVWDTLPSAMIVKVAEVFVLRRQFPLGGLYTAEELPLNEELPQPDVQGSGQPEFNNQVTPPYGQSETIQTQSEQSQNQELPNNVGSNESYITGEQVKQLEEITQKLADLRNVSMTDFMNALKIKSFEKIPANQFEPILAKLTKWLDEAEKITPINKNNEEAQQEENKDTNESSVFVIQSKEEGQSPTGVGFHKFSGLLNGQQTMIFARGENMQMTENVNIGDSIAVELKDENGFNFLVSAQKVS